MRRLIPILVAAPLAAAILFSTVSCNRREPKKVQVQATKEEDKPVLASVVHAADPRSAGQLLKGFHDVEQNAWRWTEGAFSVMLRPPAGSSDKGGNLQLRFSLPDAVLSRVKSVTISATLNGVEKLPAQTFKKAGEHVYEAEVPAGALASDAISVEFALDNFLKAGMVDMRELGVVFSSAAIESK